MTFTSRFLIKLALSLTLVFNTIGTGPALAEAPGEMPVTRQEFEELARDLAPKVNMFREVWQVDPQAEFFGGTSRDFLYWLKGKLRKAPDRASALQMASELRARDLIDVREFILYESDVDVVSKTQLGINATRFGIKKLDIIGADRFDPTTEAGSSELKQGFIPVEKIRLGKNGFAPKGAFGDGIGEIFES